MNTNMSDLKELLEELIEETPGFDDRVRKQMEKAHALCRTRPSDPAVDECYKLCLDTLHNMGQAAKSIGFELPIMNGAVELRKGMHLADKGDLSDASKSFKVSAAHFKDGSCVKGEALAHVGLARSYYERKLLTKAREAYDDALVKLNGLPSMTFTLRQLRKHVEHILDEIENELVGPPSSPEVSPPPGTTNHGKPMPIYDEIKAGYQRLVAESFPEDWFVVDDRLVRNAEFGFQVKGVSMIEVGILEKDYVFIRSQPSDLRPAEIAAAVIVSPDGQREETLKHVERKEDHWYLKARNVSIQPKVVIPRETDVPRIAAEYGKRNEPVECVVGTVEIVGKVVAVLRSLS